MKLYRKVEAHLRIFLLVIISTLILWFPFLTRQPAWFGLPTKNTDFLTVAKQYDGPLYIVPAKTFYSPKLIEALRLEQLLPSGYFAAHLPVYPFFIRIFSYGIGYVKSLLFTNVFFTALLGMVFYEIVRRLKISEHPLLLTAVMMFLPRFLVVRSAGAPESLFMFLTLGSLYSFEKKHYFVAGLLGGLSAMTKTPGILLFGGYLLAVGERFMKTRQFEWRWIWLLGIPLGLGSVFFLYAIQYRDFFAYFHTGGVVPMSFPYSVFNFQGRWVGTAWLEDIVFYYWLYVATVFTLRRSQYRSFFYFALVFFGATLFVQHRDIARYSLPLWPLACIAFEKTLTSRKFIVVSILVIPAIYLFAWNLLLFNLMPIADWRPFL
ncbi:hypothetical protein HY214_05105 [Candidatus Roizmanbacteria bacterium]|nr:hypothetical protein [Candidatus Roizmanbacteria bacterium]